MTREELILAIQSSADGRVRIEAGAPATDEYDTGWAYLEEHHTRIMVNWDSGVHTILVPDHTTNLI